MLILKDLNSRKIIILLFLILGFVFSHIFRVRFNIADVFVFQGFWINLIPLPFFDLNGVSSEMRLTTTIVGYMFYAVTGILLLKSTKTSLKDFVMTLSFLGVTFYGIYFEGTSIIQELSLTYEGQFLRIGPFLLILGMILFLKMIKR